MPLTCLQATHRSRYNYTSVLQYTIGSDNGVLPLQCQAIISTSGGILLIAPLLTNFSAIKQFSCKNGFQNVLCKTVALK